MSLAFSAQWHHNTDRRQGRYDHRVYNARVLSSQSGWDGFEPGLPLWLLHQRKGEKDKSVEEEPQVSFASTTNSVLVCEV